MARHGHVGDSRKRESVEQFRSLFPAAGGRRTLIPHYMRAPKPPEFLRQGNCTSMDPALFEYAPRLGLSPSERRRHEQRVAKARRVCGGAAGYRPECPVREQCLMWALRAGQTGVHGGMHIRPETLLRWRSDQKENPDAAEEEAPEDGTGELAESGVAVLRRQEGTVLESVESDLRQESA